MNHSRLIGRFALVIASSILATAVASCGESKSDTGSGETAGNNDGNTSGSMSGNGSLQPGSNAGGGGDDGATGGEGNPPIVMLDPNRDPTIPVNLIESGAVACGGGGDFCVLPNLTCCTVGGGGMATFSCAPDASQCPDGTTSTASCSSSASCESGQVCCRTGGGGGPAGGNATTSCEASCADGDAQICIDDAECGAGGSCNNGVCGAPACTATNCGAGELCCLGIGGGQGAVPACAAPVDALCPAGGRQVCDQDTDCPAGNTCAPLFGGGGGGGVTVCTPPPCTPTSCDVGQVCCVGGGLGGNPTCSAASATGACPGNSRLVCITDAECAPTPGTQCLLNPNGGGTLSCRVPPQPPVVADAGADGG